MLDFFFETPDPYTNARGHHRFVLYKRGDEYPLPDVVLVTQKGTASVPAQEVTIAETSLGGKQAVRENSREALTLREALRSAWAPRNQSGLEHVVGRHTVAEGRVVPADVVEAVRNADDPVVVVVTWLCRYTGDAGVQAMRNERARLEFAPPSSTPPQRRPILDPAAERLGVPSPVRQVGDRPAYRYFAAVDFGTSTSTVTLYDTRSRVALRMDPGQATVLAGTIASLLKTTAPGQLQRPWEKTVRELVSLVGGEYTPLEGGDLDALCRQLESGWSGGSQQDRLLEIVCADLDRLAADETDKGLSEWLGTRILKCYDKAFDRPPLATLHLRPVLLDDTYEYEVPTELTITNKSPVAIDFGTGGQDAVRNLKSKLGDPEPLPEGMEGVDGADATTDDLIALVYADLIKRTEEFAKGEDPDAPDEALTHLVVTFPTTTPAGTRRRLITMLEYTLDLKRVSVAYDEGVAAALYFLMRDFSGIRPEFGAEALRARSRKLASSPPQWQQNMLVIDIGAGTTDIALLRLTLIDDTRPIDGVDRAVQGKYYVIQPEVVNSTGHPQLGGNYLTLRVFYWLKAAIIDAMLNGQGEKDKRDKLATRLRQELGLGEQEPIPNLAHLVAHAGDVESPVPQHVAAALSGLLPTHWGPGAKYTAQQAFWLLWQSAETAKIALGKDPADHKEHIVDRGRIAQVLTAIDAKTELNSLIPATGVPLDRKDFEALARPVIAHAAELAWWLVQTSLGGGDGEPGQLDRVMLSGKTSMMELTRHVIAEELGGSGAGTTVAWNPTAISVERTYAKQAASIGAAWAEEAEEKTGGQEGDQDELRRGRSILKINVNNVFSSLPCEFRLLRAQQGSSLLFAAGTPLVEIAAEKLAARQEWTEQAPWPVLTPAFEVHRPVQPGRTQVWGTYRFLHDAKDEGFTPNQRIWRASATGAAGARVRAQVQIDQRLNPTLNICQGRPHYLLNLVPPNEPVTVRDLHGEFPGESWDPLENRLQMLPASVVIVGASNKQHPEGERELFPLWLPEPDELVSSYFPDYVHDHSGLDSEPVPCRIEFTLPPPAERDGTYRLLLRRPGASDVDLDMIRVPAHDEGTARYTAMLDIRGRFALHRGSPPYLMAGSLRDVEKHPGAVLHRTMEPGKPNRNPKWDPFTGNH